MKKLAIGIMTFNRAKIIREDLAAIVKPAKEYDIDIYIYDGSTNRDTESVVKTYIEAGYNHIYYIHADAHLSVGESVYQRLEGVLFETEAKYVCLCSDHRVIKSNYYSEILSYVDKDYDIIMLHDNLLKGIHTYNSLTEFVNATIVSLTAWGATIIKKSLLAPLAYREICEATPSFGVSSIYLRAIGKAEMFRGATINTGRSLCVESAQYKGKSNSSKNMWTSWIVDWYRFVESLPAAYEDIREGLYNRPDLEKGFFSFNELLRQRSEGQFDWKKCHEYRNCVKKVVCLPYAVVFVIAVLPQSVARGLNREGNKWNKILK